MRLRPFQQAFTLLEMLIVISITLILAGLVFGLMQRTREGAASVRNASQLRTILQAHLLHVSDNGEFVHFEQKQGIPYTTYFVTRYNLRLRDFLSPDVDNADFANATPNNWYASYGYNFRHLGSSYAYGMSGARPPEHPYRYGPPARPSQLTEPAKTIVLTDVRSNRLNAITQRPFGGYYTYVPEQDGAPVPFPRYKKLVTVGWADGHVSKIPWRDGARAEEILPLPLWKREGPKP